MIYSFIILAVFIFIVFRMLHLILRRVKKILKFKYHLFDVINVIEIATWIVFFISIVNVIYNTKNYSTLISISAIFLLLVVPLFFLIRDYVTGIFLKLQNKVSEDKYIDIEIIKGRIIKAGHFRLDIEDQFGSICSVSYYKVHSRIISIPGTNQYLEKATIEFQFPETQRVNELIFQLKREVLNTPWVALSQAPIVEKTEIVQEKLTVLIGVFLLDKTYAENIKTAVMAHMASK